MFRRRIGGVVVVVVVVVEDGLGELAPKKTLRILTVMAVSWANGNLFE